MSREASALYTMKIGPAPVRLMPLALLLLIAGLPDAAVVPVLRGLTVERYGMTESAAHLFMSASLVGATLVAGFASRLRRRFGLRSVLCVSAALNAILLALLALPVGAAWTLGLRVLEGGADLMVYAVLFDRIAHAGTSEKRGSRLGIAAMVMMLGIAIGMLLGGVIGRSDPTRTLVFGSLMCATLTVFCTFVPLGREAFRQKDTRTGSRLGLMSPMCQIFADRAAAGLLTTTVPLYLATHLGLTPAQIGSRVGTIMLVMALGLWPMGKLVDRLGAVRVRVVCTLCFGGLLGALPLVMAGGVLAMVISMLMGLAAAGLFASAIVQAARVSRGAGGMASFYTAGNAGFFVGPLVGAGLLALLGGSEAPASAYAWTFACFGLGHIGLSAIALARLSRPLPSDSGEDFAPIPLQNRHKAA